MVVFTVREFSFLSELKEHCLLGRFVPIHIIWGTQNFQPFSYTGVRDSWDQEAGRNTCLNRYFQCFCSLEICFFPFSTYCSHSLYNCHWPCNSQARNIFLWGHIGRFFAMELCGNKGKLFGRTSVGFPGHAFDYLVWSGKPGASGICFRLEPVKGIPSPVLEEWGLLWDSSGKFAVGGVRESGWFRAGMW